MTGRHNNHGEIAVGEAVRDAPGEPNDLARVHRNSCALRCCHQLREPLGRLNTMRPAVRAQQQPRGLDFGGKQIADLHET